MFHFVRIFIVGIVLCVSCPFCAQDVVISEVLYNPASGNERVKLTNTTAGMINVTNWWFCAKISYRQLSSATVSVINGSLNMPAGSSVTVEFTTAYLDNSASDLGLYSSASFGSCGSMVDFVQWGGSFDFPAGRENVAVEACLWEDEQFAPSAAAGDALFFDGTNTGGSCSNCGNNGALVTTTLADLSNAPTTLPVELVRFKVRQLRASNEIIWTTALETDIREFQVQRSSNGSEFGNIAFVAPAGGPSETRDYLIVDNDVQHARLYYRLKTIDMDGTWAFSSLRLVERTAGNDVIVRQVTTISGQLAVEALILNANAHTILSIDLVRPDGRVASQGMYSLGPGEHDIAFDLPHSLVGWYAVVVRHAGQIISSTPIVLWH